MWSLRRTKCLEKSEVIPISLQSWRSEAERQNLTHRGHPYKITTQALLVFGLPLRTADVSSWQKAQRQQPVLPRHALAGQALAEGPPSP